MTEILKETPRTWLEFIDPDASETLIKADLTWLTSNWECIFGRGCKGVEKSNPNDGCCVHGAHFTEAADKKRVAKWVKKLTPDIWEKQEHANSKKGCDASIQLSLHKYLELPSQLWQVDS